MLGTLQKVSRERKQGGDRRVQVELMEHRMLLSWSTVDDWSYTDQSNIGSAPRSLASDLQGAIYAAGSAWDASGVSHGIIRKMDPGTGQWQVMDDWNAGGHTRYTNVHVAPDGTIYAGGTGLVGASSHWFLRASTDGGTTWTVRDQFQLVAGQTATLNDIDVDAAGNIFTVGTAHDGQTVRRTNGAPVRHWIVRKFDAASGQWSVVRDYAETGIAYANAIEITESGIYVVGNRGNESSGALAWVTQRSTDGGATWSNVDIYKPNSTLNAAARDIAADAAGNVFAVGLNTTSNGLKGNAARTSWNWIVRKSTGGGAWSTVDSYRRGEADSDAKSIAVDSTGNVYVGGTGKDATGGYAMVRVSPDGGSTWSISDEYRRPGGSYAFNSSICVDPQNNVYAGLEGRDALNTNHWVVRKLTAPASVDTFSTTPIDSDDSDDPATDDLLTNSSDVLA